MKRFLLAGVATLALSLAPNAQANPHVIKSYFRSRVGPQVEWLSPNYFHRLDKELSQYREIDSFEAIEYAYRAAPFGTKAQLQNALSFFPLVEGARVKITLFKDQITQYYRLEHGFIHVHLRDGTELNLPCYYRFNPENVAFINPAYPDLDLFLGKAVIDAAFHGMVSPNWFKESFLRHIGHKYRQKYFEDSEIYLSELVPRVERASNSVSTTFIIRFPSGDRLAQGMIKRIEERPMRPSRLEEVLNWGIFSELTPAQKERIMKINRENFLEHLQNAYVQGMLDEQTLIRILAHEGYKKQEIERAVAEAKAQSNEIPF